MEDRNPIPLARDGVHEKVIEYLKDKPRGRYSRYTYRFRRPREETFRDELCRIVL